MHDVILPGSSARLDAGGVLGEAQDASSLFIDNGLLRVELSNVTGQVIGLHNQQAKVSPPLCHDDEALLQPCMHSSKLCHYDEALMECSCQLHLLLQHLFEFGLDVVKLSNILEHITGLHTWKLQHC